MPIMSDVLVDHINIIVSPHLDDAVISLGGLIQKEPCNTKVVTIFAGTPEKQLSCFWDKMCGFKNSTEALIARKKEDDNALRYIGMPADAVRHFAFLDNQYRVANKATKADEKKLQNDIGAVVNDIIREQGSRSIRVYIPIMASHEDHRMVRDAVIEARAKFLWDKAAVTIFFYQDMPYFFLAYRKKCVLNPFSSAENRLDSLLLKNAESDPELIELDAKQFETKLSAMKKYVSQFRPLFSMLSILPKAERRMAKLQIRIHDSHAAYCEVVYRLR